MYINQKKSGVVLSYLSQAIHILSGLIYTPIMLRLLGQSEYGLYQLVYSVVSYLSLLSFGFTASYMRFYSKAKAKDEQNEVARLNGMFMTIFMAIAVICIFCGAVMIGNIELIFFDGLTPQEYPTARILMALMVFNLALTFPNSVFDAFICGSDQIWNPIGWQPTFFLDFVPNDKIKISYAASIARDNLTKEQLEYIRKFTTDFAAISVREKSSADILNNAYPELNVQYMPDPVFLLEESEWIKLIKSEKSVEPFIFAYFLGDDNSNRDKALTFARNTGLKIIFASHLSFLHYQWEKNHVDIISPPLGVEDFLNHIANATLVLTDSFHTVAFSAIYRTPFYTLPRFKQNDKNSMNSRIIDLVNELDIPSRFTERISDEFEWKENEVDNIEYNIDRLRKRGINFLDKSLYNVKGAS